jgi:hypothetical protein
MDGEPWKCVECETVFKNKWPRCPNCDCETIWNSTKLVRERLEKEKLEKEKKEKLEKVKQREKAKDYEAAIQIWESLGEIKEAARVRELQAEMGSVQVAQSIVQGDQITEIKDSVVSKSNIGTSPDDKFTRLEKLTEMKEKGLIDDDEFKQMKKEILGK